MKKYNIALIGAGRIGNIHAQAIASNPNLNLYAVIDGFKDDIEEFANNYGAKVMSDSQCFSDGAIDAVYITSSTDSHAKYIIEASNANKAIFCEKPIALEIDKVAECLKIVKQNNTKLFIAFNRRFDPNFSNLKTAIDDGLVGDVELLNIISKDLAPPPEKYVDSSGGLYKDMMIHDLDMACWLVDEFPTHISAVAKKIVNADNNKYQDIDTAVVNLIFDSNKIVNITNSRRAKFGHDQRIECHGSKAMIKVDNFEEGKLVFLDENGVTSQNPYKEFTQRYWIAYINETEHFVKVLNGEVEPLIDGLTSLKLLKIAEAAKKSEIEGKIVEINY